MTVFHDIRLAIRSAIRSIGFSMTVIIVMALGVGTTTFAFVAINATVLQPLPYPDGDELVHIELVSAENPNGFEIGLHDLADLAEQQTSLRSLFAYYNGTINVSGQERPVRYDGIFVSANALDQIGVPPALGRTFATGEDLPGAPLTVVLGWRLWEQDYGADPAVIGATIRVNGAPATIVGVMPRGFEWPLRNSIWVPMQPDLPGIARADAMTVEAFGRLRPGVTLAQAQAEFSTIYASILDENPGWNPGASIVMKPYREEFIGNNTMTVLVTMQLATILVLLIACANVANLIMARTVSRSRELAVRAALGASRWRLVAGTLTESVALSLVGGAVGVLLAHLAGRGVERYLIASGDGFPYWMDFGVDWRVALFAFTTAAVGGIVAGLLPALRSAGRDLTEGLKASGGGGAGASIGRFMRALIVVEIALSCTLLIGGALTVRSVLNLQNAPVGADVQGVMSGRIGLFETQYPDESSRRQFWEALESRLEALPGVTDAGITSSLPTYGSSSTTYLVDGQEPAADGSGRFVRQVVATAGFFNTFRVPVITGRVFTSADDETALQVAVANRAFAERSLPGEDPVGKRLILGGGITPGTTVTIVGVVGDVYHDDLQGGPPKPAIYRPLAQADLRFGSIAVRTEGTPEFLAGPIRDALLAIDADVPVYWLQPAQVWVDQSRADAKLLGVIFGVFGLAALLLASVGVYGVLAFTVAQRTREFGVRRALGADYSGIVGLVLRQGVRQLAIALPIGLVLAVGLGRMLQNVLADVSSVDPVSFIVIPVLLAGVVLVASVVPARRAAGINPMIALRHE